MSKSLGHIAAAVLLTVLSLLFSCGRKGSPAAPAARTRPFLVAEVPGVISSPSEKLEYRALHYWNAFADTASGPWKCDSLTIEGVGADEADQAMSNFAYLLGQVSPALAAKASAAFLDRISTFQQARPMSNMFSRMTDLARKYLYDPNSPMRRECAYHEIALGLSKSPLTAPEMKEAFAREAFLCSMNAEGSVAADFDFTDLSGRSRSLHGIKAAFTVLIFGDPDCRSCSEIVSSMRSDPSLMSLVSSGKVKVADIYIDEDVRQWRQKASLYPKEWINGYDHNFILRQNALYDIRAIPSIYVLDKDKTVILKDTTPERLIAFLSSVAKEI